MTDNKKRKEIKKCDECKEVIGEKVDYISLVDDKDWDPFENVYDLLTKPKVWHFYHKECPIKIITYEN